MARNRHEWTKAKFDRYLKEGRGQGQGKAYKPWITIQDFPSRGRSHRLPGWKTGRVHQFFSDQEKRAFFLFEWSEAVIDIREQYPLLSLDLALSIAKETGIPYPIDRESQQPCILTTDFMITLARAGELVEIARTVKSTKELENRRTVEKLEIERRYYQSLNIDWGIITEQGISKIFATNVEWVHKNYRLETSEFPEFADVDELRRIITILKKKIISESTTITDITMKLDREMNLQVGTSLYLFKHLIARKKILVDMFASNISSNLHTQSIQEVVIDEHE